MVDILDGLRLQDVATAVAGQLPGTALTRPSGSERAVHTVRGTIFLIAAEEAGEPLITLTLAPDQSAALREELPAIRPAGPTDGRSWVSVGAGAGITEELVEELVVASYERVVSTLLGSPEPIRFALGPDAGGPDGG